MSSPISSALEKLDGSLLALQSEVDCLRGGSEVSDDQLRQRLAEARQHATAVRDLIRAQSADAKWGDREALDLLILELEIAAQEKVGEERRTRLLELASEFEAGSIKHRFESRVSALNALRQEAVDQLRADAALKEQAKVLPGPDPGSWLQWACNLQEDSDAVTLNQLQTDFPAVASFTGEMEENYWVPGTRAAVTPTPAPTTQPAAPPAKESAPAKPAAPPVTVAKPPAPAAPPVAAPKQPMPAAPPVTAVKQPTPAAAPPPAAKQPARVETPAPAAKETKPVEPAIPSDKKPAPQPAAPVHPQVAAAAVAVAQQKPAPTVTAQVTQPVASAKAAEPPAKGVRPAAEPVRPSAPAKQWQAAAPAPAKEPSEKKAVVAAATAAAPAVATATRMKYCDKCGSTYPAQFNVCPIDSAPLRFTDEPAVATTGRDGSAVRDKVESVAVGAAAVSATQVSSKSRTVEQAPVEKSRASSKVEVSELRTAMRSHDEELAAEEHRGTDWQALLRDKDWRALAANPVVLAAATLVLILLVGGIVWKAHRSHVANDSVKAMEKAPEQPAGNAQPGLVTNSVAQPISASPSTVNTTKPGDPNANKQNAQLGNNAQPKPDTLPQNQPKPAEVLSVPMQAPRDVAMAKRPEPANDTIEPPSSIPGALPNTSPNNLGAIAKDVPVAVPTLNQQKLRVTSGVAQAQLTHRVNPQYPPEAFQSRVHGTVVLQAVIGKDGGVKALKVVSGPPMLIKSATEAVKQWRYKPFTLDGEPVEADTQINVNFSLE